ncbi:alpha-(1,3)-fucosyltransferase 11-like [Diadema antillarum]|uniref:alpha-(1,3)-fucosyltransferase 11-like n=1 Tax=Diadema antillarum TaxID=105358 RepID=UPI003A89779F
MDSKELHHRKKTQVRSDTTGSKSAGSNVTNERNASPAGGVDWRCALLIFVIVFITGFTISLLSSGMMGIFPTYLDGIRLWKWQGGDDGHHQMGQIDEDFSQSMFSEDQGRARGNEPLHQDLPKRKSEKGQPPKPTLTMPTILWWTDALYPHSHRGHISEITCGEHKCLSTSDKRILADPLTRGILFYGTDFRAYEAPLPRKPWHEWALLHEESPMNNYVLIHTMKQFNHSATFKRESNYPTTTHALPNLDYLTQRKPVPIEEKNKLRKTSKLAPILYVQSHCDVAADRDRYVKELMKHIRVDSYGKCVNNKKMPEQMNDPVESMEAEDFYDFIAKYKFHLAFENAICDDYITEKFFRPFHVGSVPIYRGSSSAQDWAPSIKSFINVDSFDTPEQLAYFIKLLDEHDDVYLNYLTYKENGVTNEHLVEHMQNRKYAVNEWDKHSFISGFECYVCEKISERYRAEQGDVPPTHPLLERKIGQGIQMGCPPPGPSVGKLEDVPESESIHSWVSDYWGMRLQAVALDRMIAEGATDSSKLFDVIERIHNENQGTA